MAQVKLVKVVKPTLAVKVETALRPQYLDRPLPMLAVVVVVRLTKLVAQAALAVVVTVLFFLALEQQEP